MEKAPAASRSRASLFGTMGYEFGPMTHHVITRQTTANSFTTVRELCTLPNQEEIL